MTQVVVIGAGAAGIMASLRAAELGAKVLLLEKTPRIGTKILISGGGKCNITHDGPIENVLRVFRPNEARFIRPSCYRLTNGQVVELFTNRGLKVYARPDGRIFPVDQTAKDVVAILRRRLDEAGVEVRLESSVTQLERDDGGIVAVRVGEKRIPTRRVVLAVGGSSYPNSGTTGDGWRWAQSLGHSIVKPRAALAPLELSETRWREYSGVALRDVVLKARQNGKEMARWRGDLLITHVGLSGPCALGVSREVAEAREKGPVQAEIDLVPDSAFEKLAREAVDYAQAHPARKVAAFLDNAVPDRLAKEILHSAQIEPDAVFAQLPRKARNRLVECLKGWPLGEIKEAILAKGEVVAGGVSLDEVDPKTMASKVCPGLFVAGEALDVAGPVGGYNLQAAFATGYVAGESAAKEPMPVS